MSQLVLESENEHNLKLIQELAEKLNIKCRLILQKTQSESTKENEINDAMQFVKTFAQERQPGSLLRLGAVQNKTYNIPDDFNAPLDDLKEYME